LHAYFRAFHHINQAANVRDKTQKFPNNYSYTQQYSEKWNHSFLESIKLFSHSMHKKMDLGLLKHTKSLLCWQRLAARLFKWQYN
jgi:hypothetical protein